MTDKTNLASAQAEINSERLHLQAALYQLEMQREKLRDRLTVVLSMEAAFKKLADDEKGSSE